MSKISKESLRELRDFLLTNKEATPNFYDYLSHVEFNLHLKKLLTLLNNCIDHYEENFDQQSLVEYLAQRWDFIKGTDACYNHYPQSTINLACFRLATMLESCTEKNRYEFLMPGIHPYYYDEKMVKHNLAELTPWGFILNEAATEAIPIQATLLLNKERLITTRKSNEDAAPNLKLPMEYYRITCVEENGECTIKPILMLQLEQYRFRKHSQIVENICTYYEISDHHVTYEKNLDDLEKSQPHVKSTYNSVGENKLLLNILSVTNNTAELIECLNLPLFSDYPEQTWEKFFAKILSKNESSFKSKFELEFKRIVSQQPLLNITQEIENSLPIQQINTTQVTPTNSIFSYGLSLFSAVKKHAVDCVDHFKKVKTDLDKMIESPIAFSMDKNEFRLHALLLLGLYYLHRKEEPHFQSHAALGGSMFGWSQSKTNKINACLSLWEYIIAEPFVHHFDDRKNFLESPGALAEWKALHDGTLFTLYTKIINHSREIESWESKQKVIKDHQEIGLAQEEKKEQRELSMVRYVG